MSYDAEAEARRLNGCPRHAGCPAEQAPGCDALCRDARQRTEDALRAAYAAGERAGAERMRERAAAVLRDPEQRRTYVLWGPRAFLHIAGAIDALPLDGGDDA